MDILPAVYLATRVRGFADLDPARLFRTDFGDDESGPFEWKQGSVSGCSDPAGDDDVEIVLRAVGMVEVDYLRPAKGCDFRRGT